MASSRVTLEGESAPVIGRGPRKLSARDGQMDVSGQDPGWVCRHVLDATGDGTVAAMAGWVVGAPLRIVLVVVAAMLLNRLARRAVKRGLRGLHAGPVSERLGMLARLAPGSIVGPAETSVRAEQRIEALAGILRSVVSFVIAVVAGFPQQTVWHRA